LAVTSFAAGNMISISVDPSVKILVNGAEFKPKDANGNDVMTFIYNGTTYAPLRALAEAYGLEVGYDAARNMATVSEPGKSYDTPAATTQPASVTLGMKNALQKAKDYLNFTAFSYTGLIKQLEYERYSHKEAVYGADNCGADWKAEALKDARKAYCELFRAVTGRFGAKTVTVWGTEGKTKTLNMLRFLLAHRYAVLTHGDGPHPNMGRFMHLHPFHDIYLQEQRPEYPAVDCDLRVETAEDAAAVALEAAVTLGIPREEAEAALKLYEDPTYTENVLSAEGVTLVTALACKSVKAAEKAIGLLLQQRGRKFAVCCSLDGGTEEETEYLQKKLRDAGVTLLPNDPAELKCRLQEGDALLLLGGNGSIKAEFYA
jgi:hypothetical protein